MEKWRFLAREENGVGPAQGGGGIKCEEMCVEGLRNESEVVEEVL